MRFPNTHVSGSSSECERGPIERPPDAKVKLSERGFFPKRDRRTRGSRKYPIALAFPQSWRKLAPPQMIPGLYRNDVPVSLISTREPFVIFSINLSRLAS